MKKLVQHLQCLGAGNLTPIKDADVGMKSKTKGKTGEREAVALLKEFGFRARRGVQYQGGPGSPDVVHNIPGFHIEVKRAETFNLYAALEQAAEDRMPDERRLILHRKNNQEWVAVMDAHEFLGLLVPGAEDEEHQNGGSSR